MNNPTQTKSSGAKLWNCIKETILLDFPYLQVIERIMQYQRRPDPEGHRFFMIRSRNWCHTIPITESGEIILVKQYRAAKFDEILEFPGGVVDENDTNPKDTALRELKEETGYTLAPGGQLISLGECSPNPALQDNTLFSFIAFPVTASSTQSLDPYEDIVVEKISIPQFLKLFDEGRFPHALMQASLYKLMRHLKNNGIPHPVFKKFLD